MDLEALNKRLMSDPDLDDPALRALAEKDPACAEALEDARAFEARLERALALRAPRGLAERIIERQQRERRRPEIPWMLSTAAALALAIGLLAFRGPTPSTDPRQDDVWSTVAWHWAHDGPQVLEASLQMQSTAIEVDALLDSLGVHADEELLAQVRLGKICPTPDGRGAHLILTTDDGPITLMILPHTRAPMAPASVTLDDGLEAWLVNLDHGSMAVLAEPGRGAYELARRLQQQLSIDESQRSL
ncbi:DUF3379 family protein [Wenzhouxiangella marina]|uniref:Uncharacterized protein n=1 Tax=Wenzhouxiangella marina TaxID=1579979 RepID=A0A0K0XYX8_9GAMM|nr:DUF3379 family protein [Wenzhouxiangella marina]AKS42832.1 hypothetical protein WM2015_2472 [Wenzhouxiangella marina]MBB6087488.1 hypothetical protein [Wenzhouxiangella marina]